MSRSWNRPLVILIESIYTMSIIVLDVLYDEYGIITGLSCEVIPSKRVFDGDTLP